MTDVSQQLRDAITQSGLDLKRLGKAARVDEDRLARFLRDEAELTLGAASRLCRVLGLKLCPDEAPRPPDTSSLPGLPPAPLSRPRKQPQEAGRQVEAPKPSRDKPADQASKDKPAGKKGRGKS